jgi:hypothetical protein
MTDSMTYSRAVAVGAALIGALGGAPLAAVGQTAEDYEAIGREIAEAFDSTNGLAVASRTGYDCSSLDLCPNARNATPEDETAATAVARGFAQALDLPLEPPEFPQTRCAWAQGDGEGSAGLWTRFGVASSSEDSVAVMVTSGCRAHDPSRSSAFTQAHLYTLHRAQSGAWQVVGSELVWIT